jgi:hypothetical protein
MYKWRWDTAECFSMTLRLLFSFYNDLMIPTRHFPCFCTADPENFFCILCWCYILNPLPSLAL